MNDVRIGVAGLGRLGYEHACNIAMKVSGACLSAICDPDTDRIIKVKDTFTNIRIYSDFHMLCRDPDVDAIVIVTPSYLHAEHIQEAMENGKHVFCEKPLGTDIAQCKCAEQVVEKHKNLVFQLGFMRHFDDSYIEAKRKIDSGKIGKIVLIRSYTQDPRSSIDSTLRFAPHSGGQFLDMCVHDIDLIRWFTKQNIKNVWAVGDVFEFELYKQLHDADNVCALLQMDDNSAGFIFTNRTHPAGCNVETEIIGTHGTLRIANIGNKDLLTVTDEYGVHGEYYQDFIDRWHSAYIHEMEAFSHHIQNHTFPKDLTVYDGTAVTEAAWRCKESYETGKMVAI